MRKMCSTNYLRFSFKKHVPSQVLKDFSVENLETNPSTSLSKLFSRCIYIKYLYLVIGVVFLHYS